MRIFIVGSGVVGTATGAGFADHGHEVTLVDTNKGRVEVLRSQGFDACTALELGDEPSCIFLSVPTPFQPGVGHDLAMIKSAVQHVGQQLARSRERHTVAVRSTVLPGTLDTVVMPGLELSSGKLAHVDFGVASAPEFLRAVSAADDFLHPWMTVLGSRDPRTLNDLVALLEPFGGQMRTFQEPMTAELIKVVNNVFNATKISFWNEMWLLCQELGIHADRVAETVALSAEGSINPQYGIHGGYPYGGACLPKEVGALIALTHTLKLDASLIESVSRVNEVITDGGLTINFKDASPQMVRS